MLEAPTDIRTVPTEASVGRHSRIGSGVMLEEAGAGDEVVAGASPQSGVLA